MKLEFMKPDEKPLDNIAENGGNTAIFRTICCIGDSLSSGEFEAKQSDGNSSYHDMYEYSWGQFIARMCGSKVYNFSRGGMTAKEYCDEFADANGFWNNKYASQAYIIALGVNDLKRTEWDMGDANDIDLSDWHNNNKTIIQYYAQIIQRVKEIQPRAKVFIVNLPKSEDDSERKIAYNNELKKLSEIFDNTYLIDLYEYAPVYDESFKEQFYMRGHLNPMGYLFTAKIISSYIDFIIRKNMKDFFEVGFIGTDLHAE